MSVRAATQSDHDQLLRLALEMHAESRYAVLPPAPEKLSALCTRLIDWQDGFLHVACEGNEIVGFMAAFVMEHFASNAKIAGEYGLYISKESRGGSGAARLLKAYKLWAESRGAMLVSAGITTGISTAVTTRFYEVMGFRQVGVIFELKD